MNGCGGKGGSPKRVSVKLRARASEFTRLVGRAEKFAELAGLPIAERSRLLILLEELFLNVINHGSGGEVLSRQIEIILSLTGGELMIDFSDDGQPFDPLTAAPPDLDQPLEKRKVGGLGLRILRSLADDARYTRDGSRNRLVLIRTIEGLE